MQKILFILTVCLLIVSCDDIFEFSPYEAKVSNKYKGQTKENIYRIVSNDTLNEPIRIAIISDTHFDYNDLKDAVIRINKMDKIDFALHLGDMTDRGLLFEYEIFSNYMNELDVPFITCIGNHDYLSNGEKIYKQMFGDYNYSIDYKNTKLIIFDETIWESQKQPDFEWLSEQLSNSELPKIIFSHIPPWDMPDGNNNTEKYHQLVEEEDVIISIHGHTHNYYFGNKLNGETNYLVLPCIKDREIYKVTIKLDSSYNIEKIPF